MLELTRRDVSCNYDSNSLVARFSVQEYWWGSGTLGVARFDVVLVADCILPKLYPVEPLVTAIAELLKPAGVCLVGYEHRTWHEFDPRDRFRELCEEKGLEVARVEEERMDDVYRGEDIEIWSIRWRKR